MSSRSSSMASSSGDETGSSVGREASGSTLSSSSSTGERSSFTTSDDRSEAQSSSGGSGQEPASSDDEAQMSVTSADGGSGDDERQEGKGGSQVEDVPVPNKFHKFLVQRPGTMVGIVCAVQCLCLLVCVIGFAAGWISFELTVILEDRDHYTWQQATAYAEAKKDSAGSTRALANPPPGSQRVDSQFTGFLYLIYEGKGDAEDNVFTEDNIRDMRELEQKILDEAGWLDFCFTGSSGGRLAADPGAERTRPDCSPGFNSVTQYFYPLYDANNTQVVTYWGLEDATRAADFETVLSMMNTRPASNPELESVPQFVDKDFISDSSAKSVISRSFFSFGLPLKDEDYGADSEENADQIAEIRAWADNNLWDYVHNYATDTMRVLHFGVLNDKEYEFYILTDMLLLIGSMSIVFILIWIVSQSLFIAACAMVQILSTFPTALVILVLILRQTYVGVLHMLAVFVILAIGADDVFVFIDAFRQSGIVLPSEDLEVRMAWSFERAASAMLVTSATTFAAFIMTAISPFIALSTFGAFAALLVAVNYAMVITILPAIIIIKERWWGGKPCCPCQEEPDVTKPSILERFFTNYMAPFIEKFRLPLFCFMLAILGASMGLAAQTVPRSEVFQLLPEGYNYQDAITRMSDFAGSDDFLQHPILLVFGVEGIDYSEDEGGADRLDITKPGTVIYQESFNLESAATQRRLSEACAEPARRYQTDSDLKLDTSKNPKCFIDSFYAQNSSWTVGQFVGSDFSARLDAWLGTLEGNEFTAFVGKQDGRWSWCSLEFATTLPIETTFATGGPSRVAWEEMIADFNSDSPDSLGDGYALDTQWQWHWIALLLVTQIFIAVGVSLLLAYIVLCLFVMNVVVATFSIFTLIGIVSTFFAFLHVMGWTIGFEESILGIMVVGLAVDFTVHYAHSYCDCPYPDRESRTRWAFEKLGVSVMSGGITTVGATILLVFASLIYFQKYGAMLAATVAISWIYANLFFMPMLALMGPQNKFGSLRPLYRKVRTWARSQLSRG